MRIGLKVHAGTLRGTREGVPNLVDVLGRHDVAATFLFALGPDRSGRAPGSARGGAFAGARGASPLKRNGLRTLLYGTLLPGPDIARRCADIMRSVRDLGHETGVHCHDCVGWLRGVASADLEWTRREMTRACERYAEVFKEPPATHGAPGWRMNVHALRLSQRLGFAYCSDGRGAYPHLPVWRAELIRCPHVPTTLPTLDELIGTDGIDESNVAERLLDLTSEPARSGHVFTLHAELEGLLLAPVFERLIEGWKAQGWAVGPVRSLVDAVDPLALPRCEIGFEGGPLPSGGLLVQGREFLAEFAPAEAA